MKKMRFLLKNNASEGFGGIAPMLHNSCLCGQSKNHQKRIQLNNYSAELRLSAHCQSRTDDLIITSDALYR